MQNSNTEIKTANGHTALLRPFITGREITALSELTADTPEKKNTLTTQKTIELVVVSVDGSDKDILNTVLDLPSADFTDIVTACVEVVSGKKAEPASQTT